ncbi:MAG: RNA degradosome polyphosphate kinase [Campylobacterales bacterium]
MIDLKDPSLYFNRELSWLAFNSRVLEEARNTSTPLLERLKFIAIYGTNLDEFYMIRVAGLQEMYKEGINAHGADGLTPLQQLTEIRRYIHAELKEVESLLADIIAKLAKEGLLITDYNELDVVLQKKADSYFFTNLYPVIIPIAVDSTHPFPHMNNLSFALAVKLKDTESDEIQFGLVRIPRVLPRFIEIERNIFIPIESLVRNHIEDLFTGYKLISSTPFRVTRNADIDIEEDEAGDFLELMEEGLRLRRRGNFVKLSIEKTTDLDLYRFIASHITVDEGDIYSYSMPLNFGSFWQLVGIKDFAHLTAKPFTPRILPPLDLEGSIFEHIDKQDVMIYHPFESFDPVVKFINDAADDPDVLSIKMTLYRTGTNSPIVKALIRAAEEGKQVTALVELKARFDEENNLHWAKALEEASAHVIYGIKGLKVHAKIAMVIKKEGGRLKKYVHLSTGNYNTATARVYTDIGFFTSNEEIAADATKFFHHLTGFSKYAKLSTLTMAPFGLKKKVLELIEQEEKAGSNGEIIAKMNALVDTDIIRALYRASQAGVKINLIVRGICCLRPGVPGVSETIRVISIVGKYLEHARIFYFKNSNPHYYFSSADWMTRNLENRIELMTPVSDPEICRKMHEILKLQLADNVQARELQSDGTYVRLKPEGKQRIDSQKKLEEFTAKLHEASIKEVNSRSNRLISKLLKES